MSNLIDQYGDLLKYFENQKPQRGKKEISSEVSKETKIDQSKIIADTKKLIEESKFSEYNPVEMEKYESKSNGFDISKFESKMRSKMLDEYKKMQSYERPYISVTEICTCIRQSYYNRLRYPTNINDQFRFAYSYLIQKIGNTIHEIVEELYDFSETEKTIVSELYKLKGRVDGLKDNFVYDIKSIDIEKFKGTYIQEHYIQPLIYGQILNSEYGYKLDTVVIVYVLRNLKEIVPFDIPFNKKLAESLLKRAPILKNSVDQNKVCDPIGATNETCKWCSYKKYCEKDTCIELQQPFNLKKKKEIEDPIYKNPETTGKKDSVFLL